MDNLKRYSNPCRLSCSSLFYSNRFTPILRVPFLTATIIGILLLSVTSLTPALASDTEYQTDLNTLDSRADGALHQLDTDKVTLYSAAALGSTFLLLFVIRLIRLQSKKKQTANPSSVKSDTAESFVAVKCSSMWSIPVSRKQVAEAEVAEPANTEPIVSAAFIAAKCGSMWNTPVSRKRAAESKTAEPANTKPIVSAAFIAAKCGLMWRQAVGRDKITESNAKESAIAKPSASESFVATSCAPMWSQAKPETTISTAGSRPESKAKNNVEVDKKELITLLKKHQEPGESLQITLDRLKESRDKRKNDNQQKPSVSKEKLIALLKTQQKQGETLQTTLDRIRKSKRPQESDTQVILRVCKG